MTDLTTTYLGLALRSPLVASASPLTGDVDMLRALEAAGAAAVVLPSLFEEQLDGSAAGALAALRLIEQAKAKLGIPVIASLNGARPGGWTRYAGLLEEVGADAIELNVYRVAADPDVPPRAVEDAEVEVVGAVRGRVRIPVAVKLTPHHTALAHFARRLEGAGADGLVLFNRFYQPDIDLVDLRVAPHLVLSTSDELRLPLRWIAILRSRLATSLAATTGVHEVADVVKALLAGADVTMLASALLRHGPEHLATLEEGLAAWLRGRGYDGVQQLKGSLAQDAAEDPQAHERAQYLRTLTTYRSTYLV